MPGTKELTLRIEDRPGTLGKISQALSDRGVNVLGFQSFPSEGKSLVHLIVDNPATAKTVLDGQGIRYNESDVAQISLPNRPGELARSASRLGDANININYAYGGVDPGTNKPRCFRHQLLLGGQRHCRNTKTDCPKRFEEQILQRQKDDLR
jgi:hypothetical protein